MERPLKVGLDQSRRPVFADFTFLNGEKGGHVSISGVSGVATKTSYARFLLWMLLETDDGRALLGQHAAATRALVFSVKGEDLLHLDRPNGKFASRDGAREGWEALGVTPGPFTRVRIYAPQAPGAHGGQLTPDVLLRHINDLTPTDQTALLLHNLPAVEFDLLSGAVVTITRDRMRVRALRIHGGDHSGAR
jgi:hypothetical protein